jgi:hypothetical protein
MSTWKKVKGWLTYGPLFWPAQVIRRAYCAVAGHKRKLLYVTNGNTSVYCRRCFAVRLEPTEAERATHPHLKMTAEAINREQAQIAAAEEWLYRNGYMSDKERKLGD